MLGLPHRGVAPGDARRRAAGGQRARAPRPPRDLDETGVSDEVPATWSPSCGGHGSCRASSWAPARAPPSTCSRRRGPRRASPERGFVTPDDVARGGAACSGTGCCCGRRRSSSVSPRRRRRRGARGVAVPSRGEPDTARGASRLGVVALAALVSRRARRARRARGRVPRSPSTPGRPGARRRERPRSRAILARGVAGGAAAEPAGRGPRAALRQPRPADIAARAVGGRGRARGVAIALRRGRHLLPRAGRARRPGRSVSAAGTTAPASRDEVLVYPDLPAARRLALAVRPGRFREEGRRTRGPLGLGTEFESIRDYLPGRRHPPDQLARDRAAGAADVQPVPRRAGSRRHLRDRRRPADGGAARATARGWTPRSTPPSPWRRSRTRSATAAARSPSTPSCAGVAPAAAGRARGRAGALRPRAEPVDSDYELAFRMSARQAGVRARLHRPARGGRGAPARRRAARCRRAARRHGRERGRHRSRGARRGASRATRATSNALRLRSTCSPRARASRRGCAAPAPTSSRRLPDAPRARLRHGVPQSEGAGSSLSSPRQDDQSPVERAQPEADGRGGAEPVPGGRDEALDEAREDEPGRRSEGDARPPAAPPSVATRHASADRARRAPSRAAGRPRPRPRCTRARARRGGRRARRRRPLPAPSQGRRRVPSRTPLHEQHRRRHEAGRIPPANARKVTRMLFVNISLENAAFSEPESPRSLPRGAARSPSGTRPGRARPRRRVRPAPTRRRARPAPAAARPRRAAARAREATSCQYSRRKNRTVRAGARVRRRPGAVPCRRAARGARRAARRPKPPRKREIGRSAPVPLPGDERPPGQDARAAARRADESSSSLRAGFSQSAKLNGIASRGRGIRRSRHDRDARRRRARSQARRARLAVRRDDGPADPDRDPLAAGLALSGSTLLGESVVSGVGAAVFSVLLPRHRGLRHSLRGPGLRSHAREAVERPARRPHRRAARGLHHEHDPEPAPARRLPPLQLPRGHRLDPRHAPEPAAGRRRGWDARRARASRGPSRSVGSARRPCRRSRGTCPRSPATSSPPSAAFSSGAGRLTSAPRMLAERWPSGCGTRCPARPRSAATRRSSRSSCSENKPPLGSRQWPAEKGFADVRAEYATGIRASGPRPASGGGSAHTCSTASCWRHLRHPALIFARDGATRSARWLNSRTSGISRAARDRRWASRRSASG